MTTNGTDRDDFEDGDTILAGEYMLGVLDADARRAVEARIARDPAFARLVEDWARDFSGLDAAYGERDVPDALYGRIEDRLFGQDSAETGVATWHSLLLWRGLAVGSLALATLLLAANLIFRQAGEAPSGPTLTAELASDAAPVDLVARYYAETGAIAVTPVAAQAGGTDGQALELWLIANDGPPVSLGVLPADGRGEITVDEALRERFSEGAVLAVSLEPAGGSPTGAPTGPVIASGPARSP